MLLSELKIPRTYILKNGYFKNLAKINDDIQEMTLVFLQDEIYFSDDYLNPKISAVICKKNSVDLFKDRKIAILVSENPREDFFRIHNYISTITKTTPIKSKIGKNCSISNNVSISQYNVFIGENCIIEENVCIRSGVKIGDNCIIRASSVIGNPGYEYKRTEDSILTIKHDGNVEIGNNVEIKEFCSIHSALFKWDCTKIGDNTIIDAHSHIAHATKIYSNVMIGSCVNIAGNVEVKDFSTIGPSVTISNRVSIGNNAKVSIGSVVTKNVGDNQTVTGNFAITHKIFMKNLKNILKIWKE